MALSSLKKPVSTIFVLARGTELRWLWLGRPIGFLRKEVRKPFLADHTTTFRLVSVGGICSPYTIRILNSLVSMAWVNEGGARSRPNHLLTLYKRAGKCVICSKTSYVAVFPASSNDSMYPTFQDVYPSQGESRQEYAMFIPAPVSGALAELL